MTKSTLYAAIRYICFKIYMVIIGIKYKYLKIFFHLQTKK